MGSAWAWLWNSLGLPRAWGSCHLDLREDHKHQPPSQQVKKEYRVREEVGTREETEVESLLMTGLGLKISPRNSGPF